MLHRKIRQISPLPPCYNARQKGGVHMDEYFTLFNRVTDAIAKLDELRQFLVEAQQQAEEAYIQRGE